MQGVVSAHACPIDMAAAATSIVAMPGCDGHMDGTTASPQPHLCQAHCTQGSQSLSWAPAWDAHMPSLLLAVLDWSPHAMPVSCGARPASSALPHGRSPGSLPIYLSLLVLRR